MTGLAEYIGLGFKHIVSTGAMDHPLFLLALVAPYRAREWRRLLMVATAFTAGHSLTLALAVTDLVRLPTAVIEFLIPVTIVLAALANLRGLPEPPRGNTRASLAFGFGLIHGAGFANYLHRLFDGAIAVPLLGFNVGIELGQALVVGAVLLGFAIIDPILAIRIPGAARWFRSIAASLSAAGWALVVALQRLPW
jgi:HupE / UreJ protein